MKNIPEYATKVINKHDLLLLNVTYIQIHDTNSF